MIGLAPPLPRRDRLREDEEEEEGHPSQLAMAEVIASAEAVHSTHPEISVAYAPARDDKRNEAVPERAVEPPRAQEAARAPEPVRASEPARPAEPESSRAAPGRALETAPQLAEESAIATAETALAQVAAKVKETRAPSSPSLPAPKPLDIDPSAEFNGELLRRVRESRGMSLAQIADRTRIAARHLENIEADRYKDLPAQVYLRGILMNLAREYGLDPLRVSKSYLALTSGKKP